jgi:ABC-2 type transport system ATP-binding protein
MEIIEFNNITKDYGDNCGVFGIDFSIKQGTITGLLGQNGSGKTTTIKLIMNLLKPNRGIIKLFGKLYSNSEKYIKERIGFVYDEYLYYPTYTPKQINDSLKSFYSKWDENLFFYYIEKFELPRNKPLHKMSKGMKMKASIACAISHYADLLIMDEPTSGLDPVVREEILKLLLKIKSENNTTILFSSHITSDIENIADSVIILEKGRMICHSSLNDLRKGDISKNAVNKTLEKIYLEMI